MTKNEKRLNGNGSVYTASLIYKQMQQKNIKYFMQSWRRCRRRAGQETAYPPPSTDRKQRETVINWTLIMQLIGFLIADYATKPLEYNIKDYVVEVRSIKIGEPPINSGDVTRNR